MATIGAPLVHLAGGIGMPGLGLGTSPMTDDEAEVAVARAIQIGYRLIDTAEAYVNERGIGRGIAAAGVDRAELFVTTKFSGSWHSRTGARQAFEGSAERLGLDYLDLLLIHWPLPAKDRFVEAWEGLIDLLAAGDVRAIGVSNFKPAHIQRLLDATGVAPHVNQIQLNPRLARVAERRFHELHGIRTESWTPIGGEGGDLLDDDTVTAVAERHGRTPAQVVLRWHVQLGLIPVPKTVDPLRMAENIGVFDFEVPDEDMDALSELDGRGEPPYDSDLVGS
jgi:2,5-diketo-D-gluconate reductase A